jgi:hypothetical protein
MNLKGVKLTWLGHATFRIETPGSKTIIIDPWIMGNPACPEAEKKVKKVDVLLCTHDTGITSEMQLKSASSTIRSWWVSRNSRAG